jgi:thiamine-phosphate pyrophosphorylase
MPLQLPLPIIYAITSGASTAKTTSESPEFSNILLLIEAAVAAELPLVQIREKSLSARVLYELTSRAAALARGSKTRLLVNDRFDIARAAGADGVQLTTQSLPASVVRRVCGEDFLIGVSTHSVETALEARAEGADFVVFGPVFETESKRAFGPPQGLEKLREVTSALAGFPVVAIGGINLENVLECFSVGASGMAAIGLFNE